MLTNHEPKIVFNLVSMYDYAQYEKAILNGYSNLVSFDTTWWGGIPYICRNTSFELSFLELNRAFEIYRDNYMENALFDDSDTEEEIEEAFRDCFWSFDDSLFMEDVMAVWDYYNLVYAISETLSDYSDNVVSELRNAPLQSIW